MIAALVLPSCETPARQIWLGSHNRLEPKTGAPLDPCADTSRPAASSLWISSSPTRSPSHTRQVKARVLPADATLLSATHATQTSAHRLIPKLAGPCTCFALSFRSLGRPGQCMLASSPPILLPIRVWLCHSATCVNCRTRARYAETELALRAKAEKRRTLPSCHLRILSGAAPRAVSIRTGRTFSECSCDGRRDARFRAWLTRRSQIEPRGREGG